MDEKAGVVLDSQTVISLFQQLGGLQSSNQTILIEIQGLKTQINTQEQKFMPREEVLSRLREVRAASIVATLAFLISAFELWHWITSH